MIPCRRGLFDLEAIESTILVTEMARVPARILFNAVRANSSMIDEAKSAIGAYDVPCVPCTLGDRVTFSRAIVGGMSGQEFEPSGKASREVLALYRYIDKELEVL